MSKGGEEDQFQPVYARELSRSDPFEREPIWGPRKSCGKTEEPRRTNFAS